LTTENDQQVEIIMVKTERLDRKLVYKGGIVDFYQDTILAPNNEKVVYDYIEHRMGAAAVVAVNEDGKIILVRQYRNALDRETLELPAGARDSVDEDTYITAKRELEEETGYISTNMERILSLKSTVAFCNEFIDVYLATNLIKGEQNLDPEESIDIVECELNELLKKIYSGEIQDAKTVAGILAYSNYANGYIDF